MIEIPVRTRIMDNAREMETPTERPIPIARAEIAPSVISSTCLFKTYTAGSAFTIKKPMIIAIGMMIHG